MVCLAIAIFVVVFFSPVPFSSRPLATPAVRGRCSIVGSSYCRACVPFNYFNRLSSRFSIFIARPLRGVGLGFEEPHFRLMV